jgi:hypothetical protein
MISMVTDVSDTDHCVYGRFVDIELCYQPMLFLIIIMLVCFICHMNALKVSWYTFCFVAFF